MSQNTAFASAGMVLAFLGLGIAYFAIWQGSRHERRKRELEHAERMRALELGRSLPGDIPWWTPARVSVTIGALVPVVAFAAALVVTLNNGYQPDVWRTTGLVGFGGVVGGTILTALGMQYGKIESKAAAKLDEKPRFEDDAFDVVSSRG